MRGEHVIQKLASGTAALTQQKRLLGQLLQAQAFSFTQRMPRRQDQLQVIARKRLADQLRQQNAALDQRQIDGVFQ